MSSTLGGTFVELRGDYSGALCGGAVNPLPSVICVSLESNLGGGTVLGDPCKLIARMTTP